MTSWTHPGRLHSCHFCRDLLCPLTTVCAVLAQSGGSGGHVRTRGRLLAVTSVILSAADFRSCHRQSQNKPACHAALTEHKQASEKGNRRVISGHQATFSRDSWSPRLSSALAPGMGTITSPEFCSVYRLSLFPSCPSEDIQGGDDEVVPFYR